MKSTFQIKERLETLGKTQAWLVSELGKRGFEVPPPLLSSVINGVYTNSIAERILKVCDLVLTDVERAKA